MKLQKILQRRVTAGNLGKYLELLINNVPSEYSKTVIALKAQYDSLNRDRRIGLLSDSEFLVMTNRIYTNTHFLRENLREKKYHLDFTFLLQKGKFKECFDILRSRGIEYDIKMEKTFDKWSEREKTEEEFSEKEISQKYGDATMSGFIPILSFYLVTFRKIIN